MMSSATPEKPRIVASLPGKAMILEPFDSSILNDDSSVAVGKEDDSSSP